MYGVLRTEYEDAAAKSSGAPRRAIAYAGLVDADHLGRRTTSARHRRWLNAGIMYHVLYVRLTGRRSTRGRRWSIHHHTHCENNSAGCLWLIVQNLLQSTIETPLGTFTRVS